MEDKKICPAYALDIINVTHETERRRLWLLIGALTVMLAVVLKGCRK